MDGLRLHVRTAGDGPLVVLLHGWPQTGHCWRRVAPGLAEAGYRVVVPDLRGYGLTDKPTSGYDKRTLARDVRGLVARLGGSDESTSSATTAARGSPTATRSTSPGRSRR